MRGLVWLMLAACGGRVGAAPPSADDAAAPRFDGGDDGGDATDGSEAEAALPPPGDGVAVLSTLADNATSLAADATHLYWRTTTANATSNVLAMSKDGGATTAYPSENYVIFDVAVDASRVYWSDLGSVWACDLGGCGDWPTLIGAVLPTTLLGISSDGAHVLFAGETNGTILECPATGCNGLAPTVLASGLDQPYLTASDGTNAFFATKSSVMTCALASCGTTLTVLASNQAVPTALVLDATSVYWVTGQGGTVMSCAKVGCGDAPMTIATGQSAPEGIAVDDASVYWTESNAGRVDACPKTGCVGSPTQLVSGEKAPWAIVVDETSLYWNDRFAGTIMRLRPK